MPSLLLLRHGQSARYDTLDPGLSELGRRQARAAAQSLADQGIALAARTSGTLARQRETLAAIPGPTAPAEPSVDPFVDPRWDEYDVHRLLTTYLPDIAVTDPRADPRTFQDGLDRALLRWMSEPGDAPGSWGALRADVDAALATAAATLRRGQTGLVVTSGGPIAAACAGLLGLDAAGTVALHRVLANAAVTRLMVGRGGLRLASVNEQSHLAGGLLTYR